jgi:hypothetical protein
LGRTLLWPLRSRCGRRTRALISSPAKDYHRRHTVFARASSGDTGGVGGVFVAAGYPSGQSRSTRVDSFVVCQAHCTCCCGLGRLPPVEEMGSVPGPRPSSPGRALARLAGGWYTAVLVPPCAGATHGHTPRSVAQRRTGRPRRRPPDPRPERYRQRSYPIQRLAAPRSRRKPAVTSSGTRSPAAGWASCTAPPTPPSAAKSR